MRRLPPVTPTPQREEHIKEVLAHWSEFVLGPRGIVLIGDGFEYSSVHKSVQPIGEDVAGDAEIPLKILEPPYSHERIAQKQDVPTIADHVESVGDGTVEIIEVFGESLDGVERMAIEVAGAELAGFTIGDGPLTFLVHGWGGRASQMGLLAKAIAERGFKVVSVDAPGHGDGRTTSDIFQMTEAVEALVERFGVPDAVVAHSLGSMATVRAFRNQMPPSIVLMSPLLDVEVALQKFIERAQLSPWTARALVRRIRKFVGDEWDSFVEGHETDFGDSRLLIVHDPKDPDAPFETSAVLSATRVKTDLWVSDSTGHTGVLQDAKALGRVADFLVAAHAVTGSSA